MHRMCKCIEVSWFTLSTQSSAFIEAIISGVRLRFQALLSWYQLRNYLLEVRRGVKRNYFSVVNGAIRSHSKSASTIMWVVKTTVVPLSWLSFSRSRGFQLTTVDPSLSGFIQKQNLRHIQERPHDIHSLAHASGEGANLRILPLSKIDKFSKSSILLVKVSAGMLKRLPKNQRFSLAVKRL